MPHPKTILCITTLGASALAGCQGYTHAPQGAVKSVPLDVDEAMEIRDWEPMSASYTNPRFIAGPVGFWFQPAYGMPEPVYAIQESPMFLLQALALPITMWFPPPWTPLEYAGETLEPTWHALPLEPVSNPDEPAGPAEVTERGTDEPVPPPEPMPLTPAPYEETPGTMPTPAAQPMREVPTTTPRATTPPAPPQSRTVTPAPAPAPAARPATQPAVQYTPSSVTPARAAPATRPSTATRELTK